MESGLLWLTLCTLRFLQARFKRMLPVTGLMDGFHKLFGLNLARFGCYRRLAIFEFHLDPDNVGDLLQRLLDRVAAVLSHHSLDR